MALGHRLLQHAGGDKPSVTVSWVPGIEAEGCPSRGALAAIVFSHSAVVEVVESMATLGHVRAWVWFLTSLTQS